MRTHFVLAALVTVGCGSATTNPNTSEVEVPSPSAGASTAPVASASPEAAPSDATCGDKKCVAPERCITVVGMRPDSARKECWITCGEGGTCPNGLQCTMMYDGPGHVCVKP